MNQYRRTFIKRSLKTTTACLLFGGVTTPVLSKEQEDKRNQAKIIMAFASPYDTEAWRYSPHMHQQLKDNIETLTQGQVFVDITDKGRAGVGTDLMAQVTRGHIAGALVSAANLTPAAPELDILNIPFWAAEKQRYLNLVTSDIWKQLILDKISAQGRLDILFPYIVGGRTIATTRNYPQEITAPDDLQNVVFRVPSSPVLTQFYNMLGARAVSVPWKDAADFSQKGLIQALDPSIIGLYNGPNNLRSEIENIVELDSVHDGWMAVISQKWREKLPNNLREAIEAAAKLTFEQHLQQVNRVSDNCRQAFANANVKTYQLSNEQRAKWVEQAGHQKEEWQAVKSQLLGDVSLFEQLLEAAGANNQFSIGAV